MPYEVFTRQRVRTGVPTVRVSNLGRINLNIHATEILKSNGVTHVILLYDKEELKMAVKQAPKTDTHAYRLLFTRNATSCSVSAKTFFDHIKYDFQPRTFNAEWNAREKMFEIQMSTDGLHSRQQVLEESKRPKGRVGRKHTAEAVAAMP